jgi:hypothetical protein
MSHFTVLRTQIPDAESLVKALAEMEFTQVEVHQTARHLYGYQGDVRPQTAEVIIQSEAGRAGLCVSHRRDATRRTDSSRAPTDGVKEPRNEGRKG